MYTITQPNPYFKCVVQDETKRTIIRFNPLVPDDLIREWIELLIQMEALEFKMQAYNIMKQSTLPHSK